MDAETAASPTFVRNVLANPTSMPVTQEQVLWARCRPPHQRTKLPEVGQRIGYRHDPYGPVTGAQVEHIDMDNRADFNVWQFAVDANNEPVVVDGERVMILVDDPWPSVWLRTDWGRLQTREARIEGSPGWLHTGA